VSENSTLHGVRKHYRSLIVPVRVRRVIGIPCRSQYRRAGWLDAVRRLADDAAQPAWRCVIAGKVCFGAEAGPYP